MTSSNENIIRLISASASLILAAAIMWLGWVLLEVNRQIPTIVDQSNSLTMHLPAILQRIDQTLDTADRAITLVDTLSPQVLEEVRSARELVPPILEEVENVRLLVPDILEKVDQTNAQIESVQKQMPSILKRVDTASATTRATLDESAKWRPLVPMTIDEVERVRKDLPVQLAKVETMIGQAKSIGSETTSGAVQGFFKGLVATPFNIARGVSDSVVGEFRNAPAITDEDKTIITATIKELVENDQGGASYWQNPHSGNSGKISVGQKMTEDKLHCRVVSTLINFNNGKSETVKRTYCMGEDEKIIERP